MAVSGALLSLDEKLRDEPDGATMDVSHCFNSALTLGLTACGARFEDNFDVAGMRNATPPRRLIRNDQGSPTGSETVKLDPAFSTTAHLGKKTPRQWSREDPSPRLSPLEADFGKGWQMSRDAAIAEKKTAVEMQTMAECVFHPIDRPGMKKSREILDQGGLVYVDPIRGWKEQAEKHARRKNDGQRLYDNDERLEAPFKDSRMTTPIARYRDAVVKQMLQREQPNRRKGKNEDIAAYRRATKRLESLYKEADIRRKKQENSEALQEMEAKALAGLRKMCPKSITLARKGKTRRMPVTTPRVFRHILELEESPKARTTKAPEDASDRIEQFLSRTERVLESRKRRTKAKSDLHRMIEMSECTFQPSIRAVTGLNGEKLRSRAQVEPQSRKSVHERLYERSGFMLKLALKLYWRYEPVLSADGKQYFKCDPLAGSDPELIPYSSLNDDYCDCSNGTDEPGTAACSHFADAQFYCQNRGSVSKLIWASHVGDGVCDCCDGSDEWQAGGCENSCQAEGLKIREQRERDLQRIEAGLRQKEEERLHTDEKLAAWKKELEELQARLPDLEAARNAAQVELGRLEHEEHEKKEAAKSPEDEPTEQSDEEEKEDDESEYAQWMEHEGVDKKENTTEEVKEEQTPLQIAREKADKLRQEADEIQRRVDQHKKNLDTDFGPDYAYFSLANQCVDADFEHYNYKICFFGKVTQKEEGRAFSDMKLGEFSGYYKDMANPDSTPDYSAHMFTGGDWCPGGPAREIKVRMSCGATLQLISVKEPSRCKYEAEVTHPGSCSAEDVEALRKGIEEHEAMSEDEVILISEEA
ncbi:Long-chain-fatty-acid--CoA ligase 3 [Perkinsus chesapeaki]|uniref:Glucosidase 2 subunit beta n=1 Tax=Perkinsus chesapeaki TaxID=330153 RepID=A0A7J6MTL7_PERCH|nr:Long-chain-fatty-acid--CoA ligase 3 [Perkinsus chesapeaki]